MKTRYLQKASPLNLKLLILLASVLSLLFLMIFFGQVRNVQAQQSLIHEAEDGQIFGNFVIGTNPNASGGEFVHVPEGQGVIGTGSTPNSAHRIDYQFTLTQAGNYRIIGWVNPPDGNADSFWIKINNTPSDGYLWYVQGDTNYPPDYVDDQNNTDPVEFFLPTGTHTISVYLREDGTQLDKLELEFVSLYSPITLEAEDGDLFGNFAIGIDPNASGNEFVYVPQGQGIIGTGSTPNNAHRVDYQVQISQTGTYYLTGWVNPPDGNADSFWVKIDDSPSEGYLWDVQGNASYPPDYANNRNGADPVEFFLAAGNHTISIFLREDGTRLDKLELELVSTFPQLSAEAEHGKLTGNFEIESNPNASNDQYIHVPEGQGINGTGTVPSNDHRADYYFNVTQPGIYQLNTWVNSPDGNADSFWVKINDMPSAGYLWDVQGNINFPSDYANNRNGADPIEFFLEAGVQNVSIFLREDGTQLDKLRLELVQEAGTENSGHLTIIKDASPENGEDFEFYSTIPDGDRFIQIDSYSGLLSQNIVSGIEVDDDGFLYVVTGGFDDTVRQFDNNGISTGFTFDTHNTGLTTSPSGIAIDNSQNIYLIDDSGNVQQFNKTGLPLSASFNTGLAGSHTGISVDDNFIYALVSPGYVHQFNLNGVSTGLSFYVDIGFERSLTLDNEGNFYFIADTIVQQYDSSGNQTSVFFNNDLSGPGAGVAIDSSGDFYIINSGGDVEKHRSGQHFFLDDESTQADLIEQSIKFENIPVDQYKVTEVMPENWQLNEVNCIGGTGDYFFSHQTTLVVSVGAYEDVICTFSNTETISPTTGSLTISKDASPKDGTDFEFVNDIPGGSSYEQVDEFSAFLSGNIATGVEVASDGYLYVATGTFNDSIHQLDSNGTFTGLTLDTSIASAGIAIDSNNYLYLVDWAGNVQQYDMTGAPLEVSFSTGGMSVGHTGIAVDNYFIYILTSTGIVEQFYRNGDPTGFSFQAVAGFERGLSIDNDGNFYIIDSDGIVQKYDIDGNLTDVLFTDDLPGSSVGVAINSSGDFYTISSSGVIAKFSEAEHFYLDDEAVQVDEVDGTVTFNNILADQYTITELLPPNWNLDGITCSGGSGNFYSYSGTTLNVTLGNNNEIDCVFHNSEINN